MTKLHRYGPKIILIMVMLLVIAVFLFIFFTFQFRPAVRIKKEWIDSLITMQETAASGNEFPVSALLIYNDSVIGAGYNSFRNLNDPLGHAEVNALRNAFEKYNYHQFRALNRNSLILLTSDEPCMMCKGIICHHEIRHVYYLKTKPFRKKLNYLFRDLRYHFRLRKIKPD